jgi:hypothetical protein
MLLLQPDATLSYVNTGSSDSQGSEDIVEGEEDVELISRRVRADEQRDNNGNTALFVPVMFM